MIAPTDEYILTPTAIYENVRNVPNVVSLAARLSTVSTGA